MPGESVFLYTHLCTGQGHKIYSTGIQADLRASASVPSQNHSALKNTLRMPTQQSSSEEIKRVNYEKLHRNPHQIRLQRPDASTEDQSSCAVPHYGFAIQTQIIMATKPRLSGCMSESVQACQNATILNKDLILKLSIHVYAAYTRAEKKSISKKLYRPLRRRRRAGNIFPFLGPKLGSNYRIIMRS